MKKTKIICTIGPASEDIDILKSMALSGMDIARLNMKYCNTAFVKKIVNNINELNEELSMNISLMMDLEGPSINVGNIKEGEDKLNKDDKIRIYVDEVLGDSTKFSVNHKGLMNEVKTNTIIKVNDGLIELKVLEKSMDSILCKVIIGGVIKTNSSVIVIDSNINLPFMSKRDIANIKLAVKLEFDYLALSYVKTGEDVLNINDLLIDLDNDHISVISKIETPESLEDLEDIIKNSDAILIARGDLGIQVSIERIPGIQKMIINKCHNMSKVSIVAAEMLSSMKNSARPTRAEISDVANAVLDGVDAVMLSGETTIGKYPVDTLMMMSKIVEASEGEQDIADFIDRANRSEKQDITGNIAYSTVDMAYKLKVSAIVIPTMSGYTARKISRFRPSCITLALCPDVKTVKSLNIYYGIYPVLVDDIKSFDEMMEKSRDKSRHILNLQVGNKIIVTGGYPFMKVKHTNFIKIEEL